MNRTEKTCPICARPFAAHPNAIYCSTVCAVRAGRRRRSTRDKTERAPEQPEPAQNQSAYEFTLPDITAEALATIYASVALNIYSKDIRINGPIPPNVPCPPDVILEHVPTRDDDHHLIFHKSHAK